ncbi:hypothetical protein EMIT0158MI4_120175 [Burkholderia ambifaria]
MARTHAATRLPPRLQAPYVLPPATPKEKATGPDGLVAFSHEARDGNVVPPPRSPRQD